MIDLLCLGIKECSYSFNEPPDEVEERLDLDDNELWQKIDYALAHNIVYAGHDFAMDFHIEPHQDFAITKYILEEDNDNVPLIEIETGEKGKPHLMVRASDAYGPVLAKLKKYAGEGNYLFTIEDETGDWNDEDEETIDDDDDDEDFDDDENEREDKILADIEEEFLDFDDVSVLSSRKLLETLNKNVRLPAEEFIIKAELLLRLYHQEKGETVIMDENDIFESPAYKMYEEGAEKWKAIFETSKPIIANMLDEAGNLTLTDTDEETEINNYLALVDKHSDNEIAACSFLQVSSLLVVTKMFNELLKRFEQYSALVQLYITALGLLLENENIKPYHFILSAENVQSAYPADLNIHSLHQKFFWLVKALQAMNIDDEKSVWYWHNLIRMTGVGGNLKSLYAVRLENWLFEKSSLRGG